MKPDYAAWLAHIINTIGTGNIKRVDVVVTTQDGGTETAWLEPADEMEPPYRFGYDATYTGKEE